MIVKRALVIRRSFGAFFVSALASGLLLAGCDGRRRDWDSCYAEPCADGGVCNAQHRCVPQAIRVDADVLDGPARLDLSSVVDTRAADDRSFESPTIDVAVDGVVPQEVDVALDTEGDGPEDAALVLDIAGDQAVDLTVDASIPDVPGTCALDGDCPSAELPFCVGGVCVACKTSAQCHGDAPVCSAAHTCVSCAAAEAGCPSAKQVCEVDSGRCVECRGDEDCAGNPEKSFCVGETCVGCTAAASDACARRDPGNPACEAPGVCVECASHSDCTGGAPICDTAAHRCNPCANDAECEVLPSGPGVCVTEQDGHCAQDAEAIYVGSRGTIHCLDSSVSGSSEMPFCTLQLAVTAARFRSNPLLVISGSLTGGFTGVSLSTPLSIVGKNAVITPSPGSDGIGIVSGELSLRGITVRGSASDLTGIGIRAESAGGRAIVLRLDTCSVTDNPGGGIFLNGAAFVIKNTTVSRNGLGLAAWGGISVQNPPAAGPTTLAQVTIVDNEQIGLACSASLAATNAGFGVLATGNAGADVSSTCGVHTCATGSAGCGAQSVP